MQNQKQVIHSEHISWQVPYEPGVLRAEGINNDKAVSVQEVRTADSPHKIELSYMMDKFVDENKIPPGRNAWCNSFNILGSS